MRGAPLRVLCLDIEGGYGGSSRSLYYFLKHVDRERVAPEVWCKKAGPVQAMYATLRIPVRVEPLLPKVSSLPRPSRSAWAHAVHLVDFLRARELRRRLARAANERFDVVHFNHEALYLLARWLRPRTGAGLVMHNRTQLWDTWFARRQARFLVESNDVNVFITERERENIRRLAGWDGGEVIHNVVEIPEARPEPHEAIPQDGRFTVACLSNYSWLRGLDRLVDAAAALKAMGRAGIRFAVGGTMALSGNLPGDLGRIAARGGSLADYAAARDVVGMFVFLGHVSDPERVLAASQVLAKPSREDNPWGRDILEALALGLPVLACGSYEKFVAPGHSGFLYPHDERFDAAAMAADIIRLADDAALLERMRRDATARVREACDGPPRAGDLAAVWARAAAVRAP